jgi:CHAD domain-containing protein
MAKPRDIPGLDGGEPFRAAAARVVAVRAQELWDHAAGVLDTEDIERVHDMRVATRRLRAVLEIFAPCFPGAMHREVLRDVKRLADALGERRDPDVQIAGLRRYAGRAASADRPGLDLLIARLAERQARGNLALADALAEVERSDLRGRLVALAEAAAT